MSSVTAFVWQAALMLLGAYFLGTFIGCWLRRRFSAPPKVAMESRADTQVVGSAAVAAAPSSERFGRALDGTQSANRLPSSEPTTTPPVTRATPAASPSEPDTTVRPAGAMGDAAARMASTEAVAAEPVAIATEPSPVQMVPATPPAQMAPETPPMQIPPEAPPVPLAPAPEQPKQFTPPMSAAAAAAAALAARQAATTRKAEASAQPAIAEPVPNSAKLVAQPPAAVPASVAAKMESLVPHSSAPPDLPTSSGSAGHATVAAQIEQVEVPPSPAEPDDLTMIEGVTDNDAAALRNAGITTFGAIADWSADDVARVNASIAGVRRVARENWIEQAQLLRGGGGTSYSRRILADLAPRPTAAPVLASAASGSERPEALAAHSIDAIEVADRTSGTVPSAPASSAPSEPKTASPDAHGDLGPDVSQRAAFARERRGYADDLQQIDGINSEVEKLLNEQGVTRVAQIAGWTKEEQQRIDQLLGSMNRVKRERWVGQARRLSGFSEAPPEAAVSTSTDSQTVEIEPSAPPHGPDGTDPVATAGIDDTADGLSEPHSNVLPLGSVPAVARNNVGSLRSVRSEALVGANTVDSDNSGDDLKRIRGVGVLIEKRLRAMGYSSYQQIGSWTQSDVDRVNQQLDFRGRIERENWIEQARILAAGGQTEFSRRQERNED